MIEIKTYFTEEEARQLFEAAGFETGSNTEEQESTIHGSRTSSHEVNKPVIYDPHAPGRTILLKTAMSAAVKTAISRNLRSLSKFELIECLK